ncbi:hypothetical protein F5Y10DRAFT_286287 [Nemania abortiva]|nr:hypothetical protein F5Y10DRAFT_286287 [Nemania abortiva]
MVRTRAQSAPPKGRVSPTAKGQERTEGDQPHLSSTKKTISRQGPDNRGAKRRADVLDHELDPVQKRLRRSPRLSLGEDIPDKPLPENGGTRKLVNPIEYWAGEGYWPKKYFKPDMEPFLPRERCLLSQSRERSDSATSNTSDQKQMRQKNAPYRSPRYVIALESKGSFMFDSKLGVSDDSKALCTTLLETPQTVPQGTLFRDDAFESTCGKLQDQCETRIIQDIARLIVPSAESFATLGDKDLDILAESVNEIWTYSISVTGTRPQPDYAVGFKMEAFTPDQRAKLSPYIGDHAAGDQSLFAATHRLYFPFLASEVKSSAVSLTIADRQNAQSMTIAVRAAVSLYRIVKREHEVNRQILAFSISHNDGWVRIYGHYPVIEGKDTKYYRRVIYRFDLQGLDGKDKWTAYCFTKNVYDLWMPAYHKMICSAIDQLPNLYVRV